MARGGAITYWNTGAESVFGYPADAILGESIGRLCVGKPEKLRRDQQRAIADRTSGACAVTARSSSPR